MSDFNKYLNDDKLVDTLSKLNYHRPTTVQKEVLPKALANENLVVKAKTGSGKTLAYALPIIEKIEWLENKPQALIIVPTRELALQIKDNLNDLGKLKRIKTIAVYGKHAFEIEKRELKQKTHIVVGTCGRIIDHLKQGILSLENLKYLVIDEADKMVDMGFKEQLDEILSQINNDVQIMLFSATIDLQLDELIDERLKNYQKIDLSDDSIINENIKNYYYQVEDSKKLLLLKKILINEQATKAVIFANTKQQVDNIDEYLRKQGFKCAKIHGDLYQKERIRAINDFQNNKVNFLIASDVAARGLDIEDISLIIQYDLSNDPKVYVHRSGRSARADAKGKTISLVASNEMSLLENIQNYLNNDIIDLDNISSMDTLRKEADYFKLLNKQSTKVNRNQKLNQEVMKLKINIGKKKKLRAASFVGIISNIPGVSHEDIGVIDVLDTLTYLEILNNKGLIVKEHLENNQIAQRNIKVNIIKR